MQTITKHYIDGAFVESHGREVMDIVNPTNGKVIAHVTLADEEDARRAIAAAKEAFASLGRTTKEARMEILGWLHQAVSARIYDLTKMMVEEYGGVVQFAAPIVQACVASQILAGRVAINGMLDHQQDRQRSGVRPPRLRERHRHSARASRRRSADSSIRALAVNSERWGSRRFSNPGPSSNGRFSRLH
jgi:aldehyde dehydrogenase (NAD+)